MGNLKYIGVSLAVALSLGISGCGGGGGSSSTATIYTGTFVDAPVQGLNYSTATQSGLTDASGNFKYQAGETVTFKLGTLTLGAVPADTTITPLTLAGDISLGSVSTKAKNIAMLLQNLDQNRSNTGRIVISSALSAHDFSSVNLNDVGLEASMNALLAGGIVSANIDSNNTVITQADSTTAMTNYIKGYISGTYTGKTTVVENYISGFSCYNNDNYSVNIVPNGNEFDIVSPFTINGTMKIITHTTPNFDFIYAASPINDYALKIDTVNFDGKTLSGFYYIRSASVGILCKGEYSLTK